MTHLRVWTLMIKRGKEGDMRSGSAPVLLIPAYNPDEKLIELLEALADSGYPVVVVDDGSGAHCAEIFACAEAVGARVLRHAVNLGKGRALKTGFNEILLAYPETCGVVTADADGQHAPQDICRIAAKLAEGAGDFVIGVRDFAQMPTRSRAGNSAIRFFFRLAAGVKVSDTQTGLRGVPAACLPALMELRGERYEFEMNMLLAMNELKAGHEELPIRTIYYDNNAASHFHTVRDAARVFSSILRFVMSSLLSVLVDYGLYTLLTLTGWLSPPVAVVAARLVSAVFNYLCNRFLVFKRRDAGKISGLYYGLLALFSMGALYFGVQGLTLLGMPALLAKALLDLLLFFFNYVVQRKFIFVN